MRRYRPYDIWRLVFHISYYETAVQNMTQQSYTTVTYHCFRVIFQLAEHFKWKRNINYEV